MHDNKIETINCQGNNSLKKDMLDIIFGASSLIGLIFTVIVTFVTIKDGTFTGSIMGIITSMAIVNICLVVIMVVGYKHQSRVNMEQAVLASKAGQFIAESIRNKLSLSEIIQFYNDLAEQFRDKDSELLDILLDEQSSQDDEQTIQALAIDVIRTSEKFYPYILEKTRSVISELSGNPCTASIRLLEEINGDVVVSSFMRDSRSSKRRKKLDRRINHRPYYDWAAYKLILSAENKSDYFASDNLLHEMDYYEPFSDWNRYYNASLVVPIRIELEDDKSEIIGFLEFDNMEGGLNNDNCVHVAKSVAAHLYNFMFLYTMAMEKLISLNKEDPNVPVNKDASH